MRYFIFACLLCFATMAQAQNKNPKAGFVFEGVRFHSIEEWRSSRQYSNMLLMHEVDEKLEVFDRNVDTMASQPDLRLLKRYNKDRTQFGINHLTQESEVGAKSTMGWKSLHQYAQKH